MIQAPVRVEAQALHHLDEIAQSWPVADRPANDAKLDLSLPVRYPGMSGPMSHFLLDHRGSP
jgi:hypothetical protein